MRSEAPLVVLCAGEFWCTRCRGYIVYRPVDVGPPRNVRWVKVCGCRPELLLALVADAAAEAAEKARQEP